MTNLKDKASEEKIEEIEHDEMCRRDRLIFGMCVHDENGKRIRPDLDDSLSYSL